MMGRSVMRLELVVCLGRRTFLVVVMVVFLAHCRCSGKVVQVEEGEERLDIRSDRGLCIHVSPLSHTTLSRRTHWHAPQYQVPARLN